jgi:hypothetical protein
LFGLISEKEIIMIENLGLLYGFARDVKKFIEWEEEIKVVDRKWMEKSGFEVEMKSHGYKLRWSILEELETMKLGGYEIIFEIDEIKQIRRRIERSRGRNWQVLIGKKEYT